MSRFGDKMGYFLFLILLLLGQVNAAYKSLQTGLQMPFKVSDMSATLYDKSLDSNGPRIYIVGGCVADQLCQTSVGINCYCTDITDKCKYFTPDNPSWHDCADAPRERYRHSAAIVGDYLYVIGGRDTVSDALIPDIDVYDIKNDVWSSFATQASSEVVSDGAAFSYENSFYVVGGYNDNSAPYTPMSTMLAYDTSSSKTTFSGSPATKASMTIPRGDIGSGVLNNQFYVTGGWESDWCTPSKAVEKYDPVTDTWTSLPDLLYGRGDMVVGVLENYLFSIAGEQKLGGGPPPNCNISIPVDYVGKYSPSSNSWSVEESLPLQVFRFAGVSYQSATVEAIYLFGGQLTFNYNINNPNGAYGGYEVVNNVYQYVPTSVAKKEGLTDGQIAGIVIGVLAGIACCFASATAYLLYQR